MYGKGEIVKIGKKIYAESIAPKLTDADRGKMVYVDVETGNFVLDTDEIKGLEKAQSLYPNGQFYGHRVGFHATHTFGGKLTPTQRL